MIVKDLKAILNYMLPDNEVAVLINETLYGIRGFDFYNAFKCNGKEVLDMTLIIEDGEK